MLASFARAGRLGRSGLLACLAVALVSGSTLLVLPQGPEPTAVVDPGAAEHEDATKSEVTQLLAHAPVRFETTGNGPVLFVGRAADMTLFALEDRVRLVPHGAEGAYFDLVVGSARTVQGERAMPGVINSFVGKDPAQWRQGVQQFEQLRYVGVAPGIDLVVRDDGEGSFEFDHIVAPGAEARAAGFVIEGAAAQMVSDHLELDLDGTVIRLAAPYAYQDQPHGRVQVAAAYELEGARVRYELGPYDATTTLVIDPAVKTSTHLGAADSQYGMGIAVYNPPGLPDIREVYVGGYSLSSLLSFPSFPAYTRYGGTTTSTWDDAFVAKYTYSRITRTLTPVWLTYFGGASNEVAYDLELDSTGRPILLGITYSTDMYTLNPVMVRNAAGIVTYNGTTFSGGIDGFVARLTTGGVPDFASYFGGGNFDYAFSVTATPDNRIAMTGYTTPTVATCGTCVQFPLVNAFQGAGAGGIEAWVALVDPAGSIVFSTYLGGSGTDYAYGIAANSAGIYVTGYTSSGSSATTRFPTTAGAWMTTPLGTIASYVARFSMDGSLFASTFLDGGTATEYGYGIALDGSGNAWVHGYTTTSAFPTCPTSCPVGAPAVLAPYGGSFDTFVSKFSPTLNQLLWSSFLGGTSTEYGRDIKIDSAGLVHLTGYTSSLAFPTVAAPYTTRSSAPDSYVATIDPATHTLIFSTYLGGTSTDEGWAVASDGAGNIFATGRTLSTNFPVLAAVQPVKGASYDAYVTVFGKDPPRPVIRAQAAGFPVGTTPGTTNYAVNTFDTITVDGTLSVPGGFPIDPALTRWELSIIGSPPYATVTGTLTPTGAPGWPALWFNDNVQRRVCLFLTDDDPGPYDETTSVCMNLEWLNRAPVPTITGISADPVQVGWPVTLTGSATDMDGTVVEMRWTEPSQTAVVGSSTTWSFATSGVKTITLTATDDDGAIGTTTRTVSIINGPLAAFSYPAATYLPGDTVLFKDLSLPGDAPIKMWTWDFGDGTSPAVYITGSPGPPALVPHKFSTWGWYTVTLTVTDGTLTHATTRDIFITPHTPVAADDYYATYQEMPLSVSAPGLVSNDLHPEKHPLQVANAYGAVGGTIVWNADGSFTFTPATGFVGTATFQYDITDGIVTAGPATASIVVSPYPLPRAEYGVTMRGPTAILSDHSAIGYHPIVAWQWSFGDGATSTSRDPVHTYAGPGAYPLTLVVTDAFGLTATVTGFVHVMAEPSHGVSATDRPVAQAGPHATVQSGNTVLLDGSGSRPLTVSHLWRQVEGPPVALAGRESATPSFVAPPVEARTSLLFELTVHNGFEASLPHFVRVMVEPANRPPVLLVAAPGQSPAGASVVMDASKSYDPDGDHLRFFWEQTAGPLVVLDNPRMPTVRFAAPEGSVVLRLSVSDGVATSVVLVEVGGQAPAQELSAYFTAEPTGRPGEVRFEDRSTGAALQRTWDFGYPAAASHSQAPVHQFPGYGAYTVSLIVSDGAGGLSAFARVVEVRPDGVTVQPAAGASTWEPVASEEPEGRDTPLPLWPMLVLISAAIMARRSNTYKRF
jgi:PKD repeat protein